MSRRISASAGRAALTLDQLISQSNALRGETVTAGEDLRELKADYNAHDHAVKWLRKNRNSADGPEVSRHKHLAESSESGQRQLKQLWHLGKQIQDKSRQEAPARLFLMLIEMFSEFEHRPMT